MHLINVYFTYYIFKTKLKPVHNTNGPIDKTNIRVGWVKFCLFQNSVKLNEYMIVLGSPFYNQSRNGICHI